MTLKQFIEQYDHSNSIILLEGKRKVLQDEKAKLTELGRLLALKTEKMIFRSGNADGADFYFSLGVASVDKNRLQVIIPYSGHRIKHNVAGEIIDLSQLNIDNEEDVIKFSKTNKKTEKLIGHYLKGNRDSNAMKASYIIRDTIKVIGVNSIGVATFGIFYDDLENPKTGGTGHTINVCEQNGIPVIDQRIWLNWPWF